MNQSPPRKVRLFAMDVDGTLTDGTLTFTADGGELKTFHAKDGYGVKLLPKVGITPAIISGRTSPHTHRRATELGIEEIHQGVADKAGCLLALCERMGIGPEQAAFVGDDLSDIPAMQIAGYAAAPADGAAEARAVADYVSTQPGGRGAVREAVQDLLIREGLWEPLVEELTQAKAAEERA